MNPVLQAALGSVLRHFLTMAATVLVTRGIWTEQEAVTYVAAAVMGILGVAWAIWQKSKVNAKIEQALRMPSGSSMEQLNDPNNKGR